MVDSSEIFRFIPTPEGLFPHVSFHLSLWQTSAGGGEWVGAMLLFFLSNTPALGAECWVGGRMI